MDRRTMVAGAALAMTLLLGGGSTAMAGDIHECAAPSGFGQHTSQMAREHDGIAVATEHHNDMMGSDLTVGEHQRAMHSMCGEMPGS